MTQDDRIKYLDEVMALQNKLSQIKSPTAQVIAWQKEMCDLFERIYQYGYGQGYLKGVEEIKLKISKQN